MKKISTFLPALLLICFGALSISAQSRTVINDANAAKMLLGRHMLSLQWISWDYFGTATITNTKGVYRIKGEQKAKGPSTDFLRIDGTITEIDAREFKFNGTVTMQIDHINNGEPCVREGDLTFKITGTRKYWRMQEMDSPCDVTTDYVDVYFR